METRSGNRYCQAVQFTVQERAVHKSMQMPLPDEVLPVKAFWQLAHSRVAMEVAIITVKTAATGGIRHGRKK